MSEKLYVYFERELVGELSRDNELICSFSYHSSWLKSPKRFQLSLAMPLREEPFGNKITLSFFENLLPEGKIREQIEKGHHIKGPLEFLAEYGNDCAGAITLSPNMSPPYSEKEDLVELDKNKIFKAIENKGSVAEFISNLDPGYLSIAGAQDKFAAIYKEGKFYLHRGGRPTTHIVKVPIYRSGVKESVFNEYFVMKLAKLIGLKVCECEILEEKFPLYITKRYDREVKGDGKVVRIHQQDFCQAQGVISEKKYESKGGPSLKDNFELIKNNVVFDQRSEALYSFLDWICFNLLVGNNDCHSKNISLLIRDNKIELAPYYDLMCTAIYPGLKRNFSFKVGGRDDSSRIGKKQLEELDEKLGLKMGFCGERILMIRDKLLEEKDSLAQRINEKFPKVKIINRISELIEKRCRSLERQGLMKK